MAFVKAAKFCFFPAFESKKYMARPASVALKFCFFRLACRCRCHISHFMALLSPKQTNKEDNAMVSVGKPRVCFEQHNFILGLKILQLRNLTLGSGLTRGLHFIPVFPFNFFFL